VWRMLFIVRGHMESSYRLRHNNTTSICMLGPGNFCGDELISWCLSTPLKDNLPLSKVTLKTVDMTEVFGLDAQDLKYITEHFRYKFANEKLKRTVRFYSSSWRTWAAVTLQLAWRRHKARRTPNTFTVSKRPATTVHCHVHLTQTPRQSGVGVRLYFLTY
jgi:cyclic nucleotide gated channel